MVKWIKPVLVIFVFIVIYEGLVHGVFLKGAYEATASAWRSQDEMQKYLGWMFLGQYLVALVSVLLFRQIRLLEIEDAIPVGALIGLLFGVSQFIMYAVAPYSLSLVFLWMLAGVIEYTLIALIWIFTKPAGFGEYIE